MKVKATGPGVYLAMRNRGDIFDIPEHLFSAKWMEKVIEEIQTEKITDKRQEERDPFESQQHIAKEKGWA